MAETVTLDLELIDKVGGPAKRAAEALRRVEQQAQKASTAATKAAERQAQATERASLRSSIAVMRSNQREMAMEARATRQKESAIRRLGLMQLQANKMNEQYDKKKNAHHGFFSSFKEKLPFRSIGDYAKGAFWGDLAAEGVSKIAEGFLEGAKKAVEILYDGIKSAFEAGSKKEQLNLNYKLLLGEKGGSAALKDIERFGGKTRYDDDEIAQMMRPLFNAGFSGTGARSAFAAAGDLNAAGLGETSDFIEQLTKIKLKGGVQSKQLVGMGVDVPAFAKALAMALHTDTKTAMERAKEGKVDPQLLLNTIYAGIEKRQGGKLGTGTEQMGATMGARWHKVQALPEDFLKTVSESPAWTKLSDSIGSMLTELDPNGPRGKKIVAALADSFERIADLINKALTPQNLDRLVEGIKGMIDAAELMARAFISIAEVITDVFGSFGKDISSYRQTKEIGGGSLIEGVQKGGEAWSKVRDAYNIGWLEGQMLTPEQRGSYISRAASEGKITDEERNAADVVNASPHSKGGVSVGQQIFHVTVTEGDAKEAGRKLGEGFNTGLDAGAVRRMERAVQERGGG